MGCGGSKHRAIRAVDILLDQYPQTLSFLDLSPYSRQLTEMFMLCDKNNSQSLSVSEFLQFCNVARTRVAMRLFSIFDADGTGSLDFRELMVTVWHLCTLDHKGLQALVFDLYDEDNNERLDVEDMTQLLCDCYGDSALTDNPNVKLVLTKVEKKGAMNREQFLKFVQSAPQAMKQVIDVQKGVQSAVLGSSVWRKLTKRRGQRTDHAFRPENWQGLMERVIVLDLTARAKEGKKAAIKNAGQEEDSEMEDEEWEMRKAEEVEEQQHKKKRKKKKHSRRHESDGGGEGGSVSSLPRRVAVEGGPMDDGMGGVQKASPRTLKELNKTNKKLASKRAAVQEDMTGFGGMPAAPMVPLSPVGGQSKKVLGLSGKLASKMVSRKIPAVATASPSPGQGFAGFAPSAATASAGSAEGPSFEDNADAPAPASPSQPVVGYKVKDRNSAKRQAEREKRAKQKDRTRKNSLGNTGRAGIYIDEEEQEREDMAAEDAAAEEKKKGKGKGKKKASGKSSRGMDSRSGADEDAVATVEDASSAPVSAEGPVVRSSRM